MGKRGTSFWDALAWIVLILIFFWVILKVLGIINTPLLLEYSPLFGVVYLAGWAMHKLDRASEDINEIKNFNKLTAQEINNIKLTCTRNHKKEK